MHACVHVYVKIYTHTIKLRINPNDLDQEEFPPLVPNPDTVNAARETLPAPSYLHTSLTSIAVDSA